MSRRKFLVELLCQGVGVDAAGTAGTRTLSVPLTAPTTRDVTVACTAACRAPTKQTVTFSIVEPCADHLGTLRPGAVTRSGNIATNSSCSSVRRKDNPGSDAFYALRHTFRLAQMGVASTARPQDTHVQLRSATKTGIAGRSRHRHHQLGYRKNKP